MDLGACAKRKSENKGFMSGLDLAVFPGSFDPFTNGHMDIISRASKIFKHIVVGVLSNQSKQTLFTEEERVNLIRAEFEGSGDKVSVDRFSGLLVDFALKHKASAIIRGLRAVSDYDYESQMALINKRLADNVETFFMVTRENNSYISSSLVKQVAALGGDVSNFVPAGVHQALLKKLKVVKRD